MSPYDVHVNTPETTPPSEISDLPAYLDTKEFTGSTPPPTVGGTPYEGDSRGPGFSDDVDWGDHRYGPTDDYALDGEGERTEDELPGGGD